MNTLNHILDNYTVDLTKNPAQIRNVSRLDMVKWFRELDFKVGVEIGVEKGELSKIICDINPQVKLYGVDPYVPYKGYSDFVKPATFQSIHDEAHRRLRPYVQRDRFQFIEKFSMDALADFEDGSLDFVYIDGNHQDPYVTQDIYGWSKKVRSGGIMAGHDYVRVKRVDWGVKYAIQRYAQDNAIKPWFILGADAVVPGEVREGSRSWLVVQP